MTIPEAIDVLNTRGEHGNLTGYAAWQTEALDMAVRSLEEWQKVIKILTDWKMECAIRREPDAMDAYWHCIELIEHTMKKVVQE